MTFEKTTQIIEKTAKIIFTAGGISAAAALPGGEAVIYAPNGQIRIDGEAVALIRSIDLAKAGPQIETKKLFQRFTVVASSSSTS